MIYKAFELFLDTPLWGIFIFTFVVVFIAFEAGILLGKRHRLLAENEDRSPIASIVAATLGLLGFLLAFSFGISAGKFDERRTLVVEEANAIGTTYLRAGYLDDPHQKEVRDLLKQYVQIHLEAVKPGNLAEGLKKTEELQGELWLHAIAVAKKQPDSIAGGLFIQSLNNVIDLYAKRVNVGIYFRMPMIIWGTLYFVAILAIGSLGYQFGLAHARYTGITLLLIFIFSVVIALIADLDRPQEGLVRVSQQSLVDLMKLFI